MINMIDIFVSIQTRKVKYFDAKFEISWYRRLKLLKLIVHVKDSNNG